MKTRRVFKNEKFQNLIVTGAGGIEVEFPDVSDDANPEKGDKVLVDGKAAESGCCTLPDGTHVSWENGTVTEIDENPNDEEEENELGQTTGVSPGACKSFTAWNQGEKQKVEILGNNANTPFRKGNRVLINGKDKMMAKVEVNGKEIKILNGRIAEVKSENSKEPGTRSVFKAKAKKGKTVIGKPVSSKTSEKKDPVQSKTKKTGTEKMAFMRRK